MIRSLFCLFGRHSPDRDQVKHDGHSYFGKCRFCGTPIRRVSHNNWKRDWIEPQ